MNFFTFRENVVPRQSNLMLRSAAARDTDVARTPRFGIWPVSVVTRSTVTGSFVSLLFLPFIPLPTLQLREGVRRLEPMPRFAVSRHPKVARTSDFGTWPVDAAIRSVLVVRSAIAIVSVCVERVIESMSKRSERVSDFLVVRE